MNFCIGCQCPGAGAGLGAGTCEVIHKGTTLYVAWPWRALPCPWDLSAQPSMCVFLLRHCVDNRDLLRTLWG